MIAQGTPAVLNFIGNDTASDFAITFPTYEDDDVIVSVFDSLDVETALVLDVDYSLTNVGVPNTNAELSLINAAQAWLTAGKLATGYTLRIKFTTAAHQDFKFRDLGRLAPEMLDKALDRLTMFLLAIGDEASSVPSIQTDITALQTEVADHETRITALEAVIPSSLSITPENVNFTAAFNSLYIITAAINVQLPAPVANGMIRLKILGPYDVNVLRNGIEEIDGVASDLVLTSDDEAVTLITNGTDWFLI